MTSTACTQKLLLLPVARSSARIAECLASPEAFYILELLCDRHLTLEELDTLTGYGYVQIEYLLDQMITSGLIETKDEAKESKHNKEYVRQNIYGPSQKFIVFSCGESDN